MKNNFLIQNIISIALATCFVCTARTFVPALDGETSNIRSCLLKIKEEYGRQISDKELFQIIENSSSELKNFAPHDIWQAFISDQKPVFSQGSFQKLWKSQRDSFHDISYDYVINETLFHPFGTIKQSCKRGGKYIALKNRVYLSCIGEIMLRGDDANQVNVNQLNYELLYCDGTRTFVNWIISDSPHVSIDKVQFVSEFYPETSLLALCMQLDTHKYADIPFRLYDIVEFLSNANGSILEHAELVDDEECIVITDSALRVLVSPVKNFAVAKIEQYGFERLAETTNDNIQYKRKLVGATSFSDYKDYGNLWLPGGCQYEEFDNSTLTKRKQFTFQNIKINAGFGVSDCSITIPANALVHDGVRGLVYNQSDDASIDSLLRGITKSKRVMIFRYISVTAGFIMIITALILKYRTYLKNRSETT